jgi:hypothetical protein
VVGVLDLLAGVDADCFLEVTNHLDRTVDKAVTVGV